MHQLLKGIFYGNIGGTDGGALRPYVDTIEMMKFCNYVSQLDPCEVYLTDKWYLILVKLRKVNYDTFS